MYGHGINLCTILQYVCRGNASFSGSTILILSATHGIPEAIFAGVIVTPIALALRKALRKDVQKVKKEEPNESVELSN